MSPVIRIDEDVYRALQTQAEAFIDTPNTVLRRLLGLPPDQAQVDPSAEPTEGSGAPKTSRRRRNRRTTVPRKRAPKGVLLPEPEYEIPLLESLASLGGSASAREVLEALEPRLRLKLTPMDFEVLPSGVVRWKNRAQFVRHQLIQKGDMKSGSRRGYWEISDQGRFRLKKAS